MNRTLLNIKKHLNKFRKQGNRNFTTIFKKETRNWFFNDPERVKSWEWWKLQPVFRKSWFSILQFVHADLQNNMDCLSLLHPGPLLDLHQRHFQLLQHPHRVNGECWKWQSDYGSWTCRVWGRDGIGQSYGDLRPEHSNQP